MDRPKILLKQSSVHGLLYTLKNTVPMGQVLKQAFEKIRSEARELVNEQLVFMTVISLRGLVLPIPWAWGIGFAELGIVDRKMISRLHECRFGPAIIIFIFGWILLQSCHSEETIHYAVLALSTPHE
jgi:hypothetical protein